MHIISRFDSIRATLSTGPLFPAIPELPSDTHYRGYAVQHNLTWPPEGADPTQLSTYAGPKSSRRYRSSDAPRDRSRRPAQNTVATATNATKAAAAATAGVAAAPTQHHKHNQKHEAAYDPPPYLYPDALPWERLLLEGEIRRLQNLADGKLPAPRVNPIGQQVRASGFHFLLHDTLVADWYCPEAGSAYRLRSPEGFHT